MSTETNITHDLLKILSAQNAVIIGILLPLGMDAAEKQGEETEAQLKLLVDAGLNKAQFLLDRVNSLEKQENSNGPKSDL